MNLSLQPDCLRWARLRAGLSVPELAKKLHIQDARVAAWEQSGDVTWSLAEKLARATHTPFGYLFLPKPPVEELPIRDFRTIQGQEIMNPSPDLLETVNDALQRQDWYREYVLRNGGDALPFVGSLKLSDDFVGAAERIRKVVGWGADMREGAFSTEKALTQRVATVEEAGILVMRSGIVGSYTRRPLSVSEFRGFALSDKYAPIIFINATDAKAAQMFTLAHELVHIWLGVSGVSNLTLTYSPDVDVESFCNNVAAELLVPLRELETVWAAHGRSPDTIARLTRHFNVSSLVILRRLRDAKHISEEEFRRLYTDELAQFSQRAAATEGGGEFYRTLNTRLGRRFVSALVESTLEGSTPYREAFQLLGVKKAEIVRNLASRMEVAA